MNLKPAVYFIAFGLFIITNSLANVPESRLLFSLTSENKARVGIINTSPETLSLEIIDKNGVIFFEKTAKSGSNYFQLLDLSKMPDGEYTVRIKGLAHVIHKKFIINNNKITVKLEVKPSFKIIDDETLLVYYRNSDQKPVHIVFNKNNEPVFESRNITDAVVSKNFSLKQMPKGIYTVNLFADGEMYNYDLVIK